MRRHLATALRMTLVTALLFGLLYPLAITGAAQVLFPGAADGSLVRVDGRLVGSASIAQAFSKDTYFWPRPSAAGARLRRHGVRPPPTSARRTRPSSTG